MRCIFLFIVLLFITCIVIIIIRAENESYDTCRNEYRLKPCPCRNLQVFSIMLLKKTQKWGINHDFVIGIKTAKSCLSRCQSKVKVARKRDLVQEEFMDSDPGVFRFIFCDLFEERLLLLLGMVEGQPFLRFIIHLSDSSLHKKPLITILLF
jgi:hypothetical protein